MIEVFEAFTDQDKAIVNTVIGNIADPTASEIFGLWENGKCIGGFSVTSNPKGYFTLVYNLTSGIGIAIALQKIFKQLFKKYKYLHARISVSNKKSIKMITQFGGRRIYIEDGEQVFIFTKDLWKYEKRWPLN